MLTTFWKPVINVSNFGCVLPSYGSARVPEPRRPSVRAAIQISFADLARKMGIGVGIGVGAAKPAGACFAVKLGVGVGSLGDARPSVDAVPVASGSSRDTSDTLSLAWP